MRIRLLSLLLFLSLILQAQDDQLEFGVQLYPNVSKIKIGTKNKDMREAFDFLERFDVWNLALSFHFFIGTSLNKKIKVISGIGYSRYGKKKVFNDLGYNSIVPETNFEKLVTVELYENIEIPILFQYHMHKRWFGSLGVSSVINVSTQFKSKVHTLAGYTRNSNEELTLKPRGINYFLNAGFGYDFYQGEYFTLFVQPYMQYSMLSIQKRSDGSRNNLISLGLVTGFKF